MLAFPYCEAKAGQPPEGTRRGVKYLKDKIGDEEFYVLEGLDKSGKAERIPGWAQWRFNKGTGAEA